MAGGVASQAKVMCVDFLHPATRNAEPSSTREINLQDRCGSIYGSLRPVRRRVGNGAENVRAPPVPVSSRTIQSGPDAKEVPNCKLTISSEFSRWAGVGLPRSWHCPHSGGSRKVIARHLLIGMTRRAVPRFISQVTYGFLHRLVRDNIARTYSSQLD